IKISRLVEGCGKRIDKAVELTNPPVIDLKNAIWQNAVEALLSRQAPDTSE
ncbi:MAG: hypothetical protein JO137_01425, partial [Hyphomicrobiales bacterium]|nr:hypothetical protein [Hyphomicrobiales bacterium]